MILYHGNLIWSTLNLYYDFFPPSLVIMTIVGWECFTLQKLLLNKAIIGHYYKQLP